MLKRASDPFRFVSRMALTLVTGRQAANLRELADGIKEAPDQVIYHHTHRFLFHHQHLVPEPPNDFAFWAGQTLGDTAVSEALASVNTVRFLTIGELRHTLFEAVMRTSDEETLQRRVRPGQEFHFLRSSVFIVPTGLEAWDLNEFRSCLNRISTHSLYHHIFEDRMMSPLGMDDFSNWLVNALGEKDIADALSKMDPYTQTLEGLRKKITEILDRKIAEETDGAAG
ncbi:MAG: DUF5752 family protein [bacterium]